jgi:hypothetical protein
MTKFFILILACNLSVTNAFSQQGKIYNLRNCQKEMRTVTFQSQVNVFLKIVSKKATFDKQKVLKFSTSYKLDTAYLENQIEKLRKTLPPDFFQGTDYLGGWYDNKMDEKKIWFTEIFAEKDKQGIYKPYSAVKIIFGGTDAKIEEQRMNPKITNIVFIFDKAELAKLGEQLRVSPEVE